MYRILAILLICLAANTANAQVNKTRGIVEQYLIDKGLLNADGSVPSGGSGVSSITGTANQVVASGATGAVTLSLPQSIGTSSTPQFVRIDFGGTDARISRQGAAGILGILQDAGGSNSGALRIYNFTDALSGAPTNSEFLTMGWSGNACTISTGKTGTGLTTRSLILGSGGISSLTLASNGAYFPSGQGWNVGVSGARELAFYNGGCVMASGVPLIWYSAATIEGGSADTHLIRSSASNLGIGDGTTAKLTIGQHSTFGSTYQRVSNTAAYAGTVNAFGLLIADTGDIYLGVPTGGTHALRINNADYFNINTNGMSVYKTVACAGWGLPSIYGSGRATAQTAANASVATYTVGAADGSFDISGNVNVTSSTTHSFSLQVTYTDETNTSITLTIPMLIANGTEVTSIPNAFGTTPYMGRTVRIRAKAATSITIKTVGTFTAVTYNVEGTIIQVS